MSVKHWDVTVFSDCFLDDHAKVSIILFSESVIIINNVYFANWWKTFN